MNGAESLLKSLIDAGVQVCFANPGTSEMQLVAAIDKISGMRPVLGLFEGVVTGAADGYGRMTGKPAATLLHLGSGFSNGMANLHNAKRALTPIVNIIGEHATYHLPLDAPLTSDIAGHAALTSDWVRVCSSAQSMPCDAVEAVEASLAGRSANLVVPANYAWTEGVEVAPPKAIPKRGKVPHAVVLDAREALESGEPTCIFMGDKALQSEGLELAYRIASATGACLISEVFPARIQRGQGRPKVERLPYLGEVAADRLKDFKHIVTIGAKAPVSFFAYPDKPGKLWPEDCNICELAGQHQDQIAALQELAESLNLSEASIIEESDLPKLPECSDLTADAVGIVVANLLPEDSIVSDESITSGMSSYGFYDGAARHDWLTLTGGAIGQGLPVAVGAAVACPDRKVISLQADGSAMYTNQSLWTMVREDLDVCVVIFNNSSYAILNLELERVGVETPGERASSMLDISSPNIEWTSIAAGMGMSATQSTTIEEFISQFEAAMETRGPRLIEVILAK